MKRTGALSVIVMLIVGFYIGYLGNVVLAAMGRAVIIPPPSLPLTLIAVAAAVIALAWPVRAAVKGTSKRRLNPIVASRTAVLAKSSSLAGGLLTGLSAGLAFFILTRSVAPGGDAALPTIAAVIGSIVLLAAGLVAEHMCTLPPEDPPVVEDAVGA